MNIKNILFATIVAGFMVSSVSASQELQKQQKLNKVSLECKKASPWKGRDGKRHGLNVDCYVSPVKNGLAYGHYLPVGEPIVIKDSIDGTIEIKTTENFLDIKPAAGKAIEFHDGEYGIEAYLSECNGFSVIELRSFAQGLKDKEYYKSMQAYDIEVSPFSNCKNPAIKMMIKSFYKMQQEAKQQK